MKTSPLSLTKLFLIKRSMMVMKFLEIVSVRCIIIGQKNQIGTAKYDYMYQTHTIQKWKGVDYM